MAAPSRAPVLSAALATALLAGCAARAADAPGPADVVGRFYDALLATGATGAPTPPQLRTLAPWLSAELMGLLTEAGAARDREALAAPDEKPPFVEGSLFTSLFEGHTRLEVVADTLVDGEHRLTVRFTYDDPPPAVTWSDLVIVRVEEGRPVIADVEYGGDWDFANRGRLVASLREALSGYQGGVTVR